MNFFFSFSPTQRRVNFDSIYDPIVTLESQEAHGVDTTENQEAHSERNENIGPELQSIEEDYRYNFSSFPRRIRKGQPPRIIRSQSLYGTPHSLAWGALRQFSEGMPMETPSSIHSNDRRSFIYDEPTLMSPGEGSLYSVIVDDGSLQRRRISLNSEYSRFARFYIYLTFTIFIFIYIFLI
jgi:hypothetical protein